MISHRKGVLLDGIGSELVRASTGGVRKTLSKWLGDLSSSINLGDIASTFTSGDATPSVLDNSKFITAGSTAITNFDDGVEGQTITIYRGASDIAITDNATIDPIIAGNLTLSATRPSATFRLASGVWKQVEEAGAASTALLPVTQAATLQAGRRALNSGPWVSIFDYITDATTRADILAFTQTADVSAYVQAACDAADDIGAAIYFPPGRYPILSTITTEGVSFLGDQFVEDLYPYGSKGTVFVFTSTANTPFKLGESVLFQGIVFYWPNQIESAATWVANTNAPIAYPPLIENASTTTSLTGFAFFDNVVLNAYDFIDVGGNTAFDKGGRWNFSGNRICALRRTFNLNNIPDVISCDQSNIWGWNVYGDEVLHFGGAGTAATISVTSITRSSGTATVTTSSAHGLTTGRKATIAGATQTDYNGTYVVTVTGATTFTYTVANSPATPATGTITNTAYYLRDYLTDNSTFLRVWGDAAIGASSTYSVDGFLMGGFHWGFRRVVDVDGGMLSILNSKAASFDGVQQILHTRNYGVIASADFDMGGGSFVTKNGYTETATPPAFEIDTPAPQSGAGVTTLRIRGNMGYCCGTFLKATGDYVRSIDVDAVVNALGHLTTDAGTYYAADINCANARVSFRGAFTATAASTGSVVRTGIRMVDSASCNISSAMFTSLTRPIDVTDTAGAYEISGCTSTGTADTYSLNSATANIVAMGNYFDKRNYEVEPLSPLRVASAVNGVEVRGAATGSPPRLTAIGGDTNVSLVLDSKGTGDVQLRPGAVPGLVVSGIASAVNYAQIIPAATGNGVTFAVIGGDTNISLALQPKGSGIVYTTADIQPTSNNVRALGAPALAFSNLYLGSGASFNINNGNWVATHTSGILTVGTGDLRVTTAGTNSASVVTVGGAQTLTNKTLPVAAFGSTTYTVLGMGFVAAGVNFNSANTDNAIAITLPVGFTRYRVVGVQIDGASQTLTTATCGVFTATAAGGTAIVASGSAITVSTASEGTNNNMMGMTIVNANTTSYAVATVPTLYFRVQTAQGAAATASVTIQIQPLP